MQEMMSVVLILLSGGVKGSGSAVKGLLGADGCTAWFLGWNEDCKSLQGRKRWGPYNFVLLHLFGFLFSFFFLFLSIAYGQHHGLGNASASETFPK